MIRGSLVRVTTTKWPDRPHWVYAGVWLGEDEHGGWVGYPVGSRFTRPGADYVAPYAQVGLVPHAHVLAAVHPGAGWLPAFHDVGGPLEVYVDVTTPPRTVGTAVRAVDLDLDVLRGPHGRTWVDDEDEFADHRVRFGYPDEVVAAALASCAAVERAVAAREAPYDAATPARWLRVLADLAGDPAPM